MSTRRDGHRRPWSSSLLAYARVECISLSWRQARGATLPLRREDATMSTKKDQQRAGQGQPGVPVIPVAASVADLDFDGADVDGLHHAREP